MYDNICKHKSGRAVENVERNHRDQIVNYIKQEVDIPRVENK